MTYELLLELFSVEKLNSFQSKLKIVNQKCRMAVAICVR